MEKEKCCSTQMLCALKAIVHNKIIKQKPGYADQLLPRGSSLDNKHLEYQLEDLVNSIPALSKADDGSDIEIKTNPCGSKELAFTANSALTLAMCVIEPWNNEDGLKDAIDVVNKNKSINFAFFYSSLLTKFKNRADLKDAFYNKDQIRLKDLFHKVDTFKDEVVKQNLVCQPCTTLPCDHVPQFVSPALQNMGSNIDDYDEFSSNKLKKIYSASSSNLSSLTSTESLFKNSTDSLQSVSDMQAQRKLDAGTKIKKYIQTHHQYKK
jgi:hypothetical protein